MKNKIYLITVLIVLLFGGVFVGAEDEVVDYGQQNGLPPGWVTGNGMSIGNQNVEGFSLTFTNDGAQVNVKGDVFENIVPQNKDNSFISLGNNGRIVGANFLVNGNGGSFCFGNTCINAPPNSRVIFNEEPGINVLTDENSEITETPKAKDNSLPQEYSTTYEGRNTKISENVFSGKVEVSNGKIIKAFEGTTAQINGIEHQVTTGDLEISYDENFNPLEKKGKNYFNYGKNKIALGGSGFKSELKEGNSVFPEFLENKYEGSFSEKKGRLIFTPKGGNIEATKVSPNGNPLALDIKSEGKFEIKNGKWVLESDGKNVYANVERGFRISSDMKFEYTDNTGKQIKYDLDVRTTFRNPVSASEKAVLERELNAIDNQIKQKENEIKILRENHPKLERVLDIENQLEPYYEEIREIDRINNENVRTERIRALDGRYAVLLKDRNSLSEFNEEYKKLLDLVNEQKKLVDSYNNKFEIKEFGRINVGAFGQIISSENGDSKVSYSEYVEGFPVIKNTDVKEYSFENGKVTTTTSRKNNDILAGGLIPDSKFQTCADTQIEMRALYEHEQLRAGNQESIKFTINHGDELSFNSDGTYTIFDGKKVVRKQYNPQMPGNEFVEWVENVQIFTNTGQLRKQLIPVQNIDDLKPGDIITYNPDRSGYGHTVGIKEIIKLNGETYYRAFAGSDPTIDAQTYRELKSKTELKYYLENLDASISRFRDSSTQLASN